MSATSSAALKTIAGVRIATSVFFLLFGEYKLAGPGFAHGGFQGYLRDFIANGAVSFYRPLLSNLILVLHKNLEKRAIYAGLAVLSNLAAAVAAAVGMWKPASFAGFQAPRAGKTAGAKRTIISPSERHFHSEAPFIGRSGGIRCLGGRRTGIAAFQKAAQNTPFPRFSLRAPCSNQESFSNLRIAMPYLPLPARTKPAACPCENYACWGSPEESSRARRPWSCY